MPCPQHAGKHPFHDHRYVVTSDAELSYGHDPRDESWGLSSGAIICQMRDGPPERAHLVAAAPQMLDALIEARTVLAVALSWPGSENIRNKIIIAILRAQGKIK